MCGFLFWYIHYPGVTNILDKESKIIMRKKLLLKFTCLLGKNKIDKI